MENLSLGNYRPLKVYWGFNGVRNVLLLSYRMDNEIRAVPLPDFEVPGVIGLK